MKNIILVLPIFAFALLSWTNAQAAATALGATLLTRKDETRAYEGKRFVLAFLYSVSFALLATGFLILAGFKMIT